MGDFKELAVWQQARVLVKEVYLATGAFPSSERYGLAIQLRRAAVSIASNVAEGAGIGGDRPMLRHLRIARGSTAEVECQLLLARDAEILNESSWRLLDSQVRRVGRMLTALISALAHPACQSQTASSVTRTIDQGTIDHRPSSIDRPDP